MSIRAIDGNTAAVTQVKMNLAAAPKAELESSTSVATKIFAATGISSPGPRVVLFREGAEQR